MVGLLVLTAAVAAGSAMAKKESPATTVGLNSPEPLPNRGHVASLVTIELNDDDSTTVAFEIKDFSFSVENPTTIGSATSGAGAGKIKFNEFTITKRIDKASPVLFKSCASGEHYKKVTLQMRKAGGDPSTAGKPFLMYSFSTVFTTNIDWSGPGDEGPEESITFVYGKLGIQYTNLQTGETSSFEWDQVENRES
jgi:type VI secretion system Hcp family effector